MAEELGERTEQPTGRKLSRARSEGRVPKSQEFTAAIDMLGSVLLIVFLGPYVFDGAANLLKTGLSAERLTAAPAGELRAQGIWALSTGVRLAAPFLAIMALFTAAAQVAQIGWLWTLKPISPKWDRLNPLTGVKKFVGKRNLVKTLVSSLKLAIVLFIAFSVISFRLRPMAFLPALSGVAALHEMGDIVFDLVAWLLALLLILGIIDLVYNRWQHRQDLRMTKQEVKDERRSVEGDEQTKARRLRMARTMLLQQMQQAIQTADVIVTNPTHFAVAIKYDPDTMHAPRVVAKGADYMAFRIRELARTYSVPIVEKPALARALYAGADVGRSISHEFYQAVAEILAYVYRLKDKAA
ncbi:MAG: flagellar biosynthesis protein FlhB [Phycisphaerales bacterium]